jgi:hypothetical protein
MTLPDRKPEEYWGAGDLTNAFYMSDTSRPEGKAAEGEVSVADVGEPAQQNEAKGGFVDRPRIPDSE